MLYIFTIAVIIKYGSPVSEDMLKIKCVLLYMEFKKIKFYANCLVSIKKIYSVMENCLLSIKTKMLSVMANC